MTGSAPVSKDGAAPWFETRRLATLLTMRPLLPPSFGLLSRLPPLLQRAPFARLARAAPAAAPAFAVRAPDHVLEIVDAVYFCVGIAGMVEVARDIAARRAVDRPAAVEFVKVKVAARLEPVGFLGGQLAALVF